MEIKKKGNIVLKKTFEINLIGKDLRSHEAEVLMKEYKIKDILSF